MAEIAAMGPKCTESSAFCQKIRQGASVFEPKCRVELFEIEQQGTIGASIQGSKKARRVAERPHCAAFCHNRPSMPQQTSQNTITSQGAFVSQARDPWSMAHGSLVMALRSNSPMVPLATIVLRSYSPRAQVQSCHKLRHKPKPDLTHQHDLPGDGKYQPDAKKPPGWVAFKFQWCRRRDLNPHARYVGTSTSS